MCTGDNLDTAKAIGKDAGILTESDIKSQYTCMAGKEFREAVGGLKQMDDIKNVRRDRSAAANNSCDDSPSALL